MATFQGKVAIVTGGAKGIGKGIAKEFAEEGARVAIADVDDEAGAETAAEVPGAMFVHADVASNEDCRRLVAQTVTEFGGVDVLVNNAGIQPPESYQNVEGTSEETWDRIIDVNLKSCFLMSKHAIPEMRKRGGGAIVNIASVQGLQSQNLVPPYAASKGGVLSLTRPDGPRLRVGEHQGPRRQSWGNRHSDVARGGQPGVRRHRRRRRGVGDRTPPGPYRNAARHRRRGGLPGQR